MGLFAKFKEAWLKPMSFDSLNEGFYDDLEEALILADVGMDTAVDAVAQLKKRAYAKLLTHEEDVKNALRDILAEKLSVGDPALDLSTRPSVASSSASTAWVRPRSPAVCAGCCGSRQGLSGFTAAPWDARSGSGQPSA